MKKIILALGLISMIAVQANEESLLTTNSNLCESMSSQEDRVSGRTLVSSKYIYCHLYFQCEKEERIVLGEIMGDKEIIREDFDELLKPYCTNLINHLGEEVSKVYENSATYFFNCDEAAPAFKGTCLETK